MKLCRISGIVLILLILNVALMVPIQYLITPNVSKQPFIRYTSLEENTS